MIPESPSSDPHWLRLAKGPNACWLDHNSGWLPVRNAYTANAVMPNIPPVNIRASVSRL